MRYSVRCREFIGVLRRSTRPVGADAGTLAGPATGTPRLVHTHAVVPRHMSPGDGSP